MGLSTVLKPCLKGGNTNITKNDLKFKKFVEKRIKREKEVGALPFLFFFFFIRRSSWLANLKTGKLVDNTQVNQDANERLPKRCDATTF